MRYARQIILPEIGEEGQKQLRESSALIVGAGGLGSPAAIYLAAAGIGKITVADADEVRSHNLNRQILYREKDLGFSKVKRAKNNLSEFNSDIEVKTIGRLNEANIYDYLSESDYDIIVDGTDNFETRYAVNSASVVTKIPYLYASVLGWKGQIALLNSKDGPCYECIYQEAPSPEESPTCVKAGVIGAVPGIIGVMEAAEVIKYLLNRGENLAGKMLNIDILKNEYHLFELSKDPLCKACGKNSEK